MKNINTLPKKFDNIEFKTLLNRLTVDTDNGLEVLGLRSKHRSNEISFYGNEEDNYTLIVEDFGKMVKGKWIELEPTSEQLEQLKSALSTAVDKVSNELEEAERQEIIDQRDAYEMESTYQTLTHI